MKRIACVLLAAAIALEAFPTPARSAVEVNRVGSENPMVEVFKSTVYGALAGLVVGGAISLATKDDSGEPLRWGFVGGTAVGLGYGLWWVSSRPQPTGLLQIEQGEVHLTALPTVEVGKEMRVYLLTSRF